LRLLLKQQLNLVLETQNTARGLVVRISDVLFHFNDFTLTPEHAKNLRRSRAFWWRTDGLCPRLEGYTDNVGSDAYNLQGLGSTNPAAPNATAAGRERNRRVEMLIQGDVGSTHQPDRD